MSRAALNTSVAIPLPARTHAAHATVRVHLADAEVCLTGLSAAEADPRMGVRPEIAAPSGLRPMDLHSGREFVPAAG